MDYVIPYSVVVVGMNGLCHTINSGDSMDAWTMSRTMGGCVSPLYYNIQKIFLCNIIYV